jgi:hypothetical protein
MTDQFFFFFPGKSDSIFIEGEIWTVKLNMG